MGVTVLNESGPYVTPTGAYTPSCGENFYVGSTLPQGQIGEKIADRFFTTTDKALNACVSGRGDTVNWLPGYTESIASADAWSSLGTKTDVTCISMGRGTNRATLTWTAATSTVLFDAANFKIRNARLFLAGPHAAGSALTVAAPITISAAGWGIDGCDIFWGFDADQIVTIGITTTAAADYGTFNGNYCRAETAAVPTTTFLRLVGADYMQMHDTKIQGPGSTTTLGPVQFLTTASLGLDWRRSIVQNQLAASVHAVTGLAGITGTALQCGWGILDNATLAGFVTPGNMQFFACYTANENGEEGALMTPVSA